MDLWFCLLVEIFMKDKYEGKTHIYNNNNNGKQNLSLINYNICFFFNIGSVHTQNIWLLGLTSTWAHNLFVLWAFGFPTVGGPMIGKPKYAFVSSRLSLFLTKSLLCSL